MTYTINCTVNFPDDTDYEYRPTTVKGVHKVLEWIEHQMVTEPGASSFIFTVVIGAKP